MIATLENCKESKAWALLFLFIEPFLCNLSCRWHSLFFSRASFQVISISFMEKIVFSFLRGFLFVLCSRFNPTYNANTYKIVSNAINSPWECEIYVHFHGTAWKLKPISSMSHTRRAWILTMSNRYTIVKLSYEEWLCLPVDSFQKLWQKIDSKLMCSLATERTGTPAIVK